MIVLPIELRASGARQTLYSIEITNDCTGDLEVGSYQVRLLDGRGECRASAHIFHRRDRGALALVASAMRSLADQAPSLFS